MPLPGQASKFSSLNSWTSARVAGTWNRLSFVRGYTDYRINVPTRSSRARQAIGHLSSIPLRRWPGRNRRYLEASHGPSAAIAHGCGCPQTVSSSHACLPLMPGHPRAIARRNLMTCCGDEWPTCGRVEPTAIRSSAQQIPSRPASPKSKCRSLAVDGAPLAAFWQPTSPSRAIAYSGILPDSCHARLLPRHGRTKPSGLQRNRRDVLLTSMRPDHPLKRGAAKGYSSPRQPPTDAAFA